MYISVGHQADEHLEALDLLLNQQSFEFSGSSQQKLQNSESNHTSASVEIRPDFHREQRKGVPEVIFGETKNIEQIVSMTRKIVDETGRTIISRVPTEAIEVLRDVFNAYHVRVLETARAVVIYKPDYVHRKTGGQVGVISAGTSDVPVAQEAALIAEEMGCEVTCIYDVGVAGLHRLLEPLRDLLSKEVDAIIVAAGMDGALPSVVAGLVPVPVIGLPTSIGYGMGGKGVAALLSMLQTCAPGLSVVNIDNGVGAGITAAMIANRVAMARARSYQSQ
jgi:NCAIR mutase (PurE)-related protein